MKYAFEITFADGKSVIVHERNYSCAITLAAWERMQGGGECYGTLHVASGVRRPDLDQP